MKKQKLKVVIGIILFGLVCMALVFSASAEEYKDRQEAAHEIAELARSLGLPEDDPIIKRAQEIWWEAEEEKNREYLGNYYITGYDPYCSHCCGKSDGITASGKPATPGYTIAMKGMPFGTKVYIDGLGTFEVQDRGVGKGVIDIALSGHSACYAVTGRYDVWAVR